MRTWIYNRINDLPDMPEPFKTKIVSSGSADDPTPPFAVVQLGVEQPALGITKKAGAFTLPFTVWLHDKPGSMLTIDAGAVALKDGLQSFDGVVVGGVSVLELAWSLTGEDAFDDHYGTNTRPVRFLLTACR